MAIPEASRRYLAEIRIVLGPGRLAPPRIEAGDRLRQLPDLLEITQRNVPYNPRQTQTAVYIPPCVHRRNVDRIPVVGHHES
jgi:hypothetical protein